MATCVTLHVDCTGGLICHKIALPLLKSTSVTCGVGMISLVAKLTSPYLEHLIDFVVILFKQAVEH